ncbi:MAG: tetratricopeptide repeat protein [Planctomycetota bacterium]|jgi:thioredoxin-like negative regulator of GroEL
MAVRVESKKLKMECFALGFSPASVLFFVLLLCLAFLSVGCNEPQADATAIGQQEDVSADARKAELLRLLERKFENPDAHFQIAQLYHAEGQWAKAEYHYNVALGFDPASADAKAAMVKLFLDAGDSAKSKTYADVYMNQAANSVRQSLKLGMAFQKQQLDGYTLDSYQQALSLEPDSAEVNKQMGFYYLSKGDEIRAKEHFIVSYRSDNGQPDVAHELGRLGVELRIRPQSEEDTEGPDERGG